MNKKIVFTMIALLLVGAVAFAGGKKERRDLPEFVLNPPISEDAVYGVGYAKTAQLAQSLTIAKTRARADIARQVETQIQSVMTDYFQEAGIPQNSQTIQFVESITREITETRLYNSTVRQQYPTQDGGVWVLISYAKNDAVKALEETANKFVRSDEAAFAEFKAKEASAMLDKLMSEKPTKSEPVKE